MSLSRHFMLAALLPLFAAACAEPPGQSAEYYVFGTLVDVRLPEASPEDASEIFAELQQELQRMHLEWHAWEPGDLTRLNQALQAGRSEPTTRDIVALIQRSQRMEERSGGRFNAAIGKLVALWGFHTSEFPVAGPPPAPEAIQVLIKAHPSAFDVEFANGEVLSHNPEVQFDFGGIAKGYALDRACEIIRDAGHDSAIVNAGGDVRAMGDKRGKRWRIALRDPKGGIAGAIEISGDRAIFTSGNYERYREDAGKRYPHILDPRTGWPVAEVASATVIARDGATADAAATAMVVAGPYDWLRVAYDMGIEAALMIDREGRMEATQAMMEFFSPADGREVTIFAVD